MGAKTRKTHEQFLIDFEKRQPILFSRLQILGNYINTNTHILVKTKYGNHLVTPEKLLIGKSPKIESATNKNEYFVNRALEIHGNLYNYKEVEYINSITKVKILSEKGIFWQTPRDHLMGKGCPLLGRDRTIKASQNNPTGWSYTNWEKAGNCSKHFDSFKCYVIKCWNDDKTEIFYKIGKTFNTVKQRFSDKILLPYKYQIIKEVIEDAQYICKLEVKLKNQYKKYKYIPKLDFKGKHECFSELPNLQIPRELI